jgi:hypothetical protein
LIFIIFLQRCGKYETAGVGNPLAFEGIPQKARFQVKKMTRAGRVVFCFQAA